MATKHFGEIISRGGQVVGPGSIHPDTGTPYQVEADVDIATVSEEFVLAVLENYIPHRKTNGETGSGSEAPGSENGEGRGEGAPDAQATPSLTGSEAGKKLNKQFGEPFDYNRDGELTGVNEVYWAGLHQTENLQWYDPKTSEFRRYDLKTGVYRMVSEAVIKQEISARILEVSRQLKLPALARRRTNRILTNIIEQLKGIAEKRDDDVCQDTNAIVLQNGVIRIHSEPLTADFCSFSPEFRALTRCPIPFDPAATCPRFEQQLLRRAVSAADALMIQKYAGQILIGANPIQRLLFLTGTAAQGKSVLAGVIQRLAGLENVTQLRTKHLDSRFELFRCRNKKLLVGVDVGSDFLVHRGARGVKGLVGGDWFDAEMKGGTESHQFRGTFNIMVVSNSRLIVYLEGDQEAWRRRVLVVRFDGAPVARKIRNFDEVLIREEGSGILNWALLGLHLLLQDIEDTGDIRLTREQERRVDELMAESDSLRHFLDDRVIRDSDADLSVAEIVEAYAEYCPTRGWNPKPITVLHKELEGLMLELFGVSKAHSIMRGGRSVKGFRGVALAQLGVHNEVEL